MRAGLRAAFIEVGATRVKPIVPTAAAAVIGAAPVLTDTNLLEAAISVLFGLASSAALTLLGTPAIYCALRNGQSHK